MYGRVLEQMIKGSGATITKTLHFVPKNTNFWPKTAFWGHELSVVGPHTLFGMWWTQKNVLCKVLEQFIQCFGTSISKKVYFLHKNEHVWFELYKSCYSQLGGESHISRIRPISDGIKPALSIQGLGISKFEGWGRG